MNARPGTEPEHEELQLLLGAFVLGGLDPAAQPAEDYDFCLRVSEATEIQHLARPLYLYRVHRGNISSQKRLEQIEAAKQAIARALQRRGMDRDFDVEVELIGKFRLARRSKDRT